MRSSYLPFKKYLIYLGNVSETRYRAIRSFIRKKIINVYNSYIVIQ